MFALRFKNAVHTAADFFTPVLAGTLARLGCGAVSCLVNVVI